MDLAIIPECYVDTNLIETIVPPIGKGYNHQKGCGTVTKVMKENFSDRFALGIIDKDKKQVDYLNEFNEVKNYGTLILHKHNQKHHYIIQIFPAVEKFFLDNATAVGLSLQDYDIPGDFEELKRNSKTAKSKNDPKYRKLFKDIKNAGTKDFKILAEWIIYLRDNPYTAKIDDLQ